VLGAVSQRGFVMGIPEKASQQQKTAFNLQHLDYADGTVVEDNY
jgi:hypothetical protein